MDRRGVPAVAGEFASSPRLMRRDDEERTTVVPVLMREALGRGDEEPEGEDDPAASRLFSALTARSWDIAQRAVAKMRMVTQAK